jgi:mRNA degradation ribonuclease J1/J2
MATGLKTLWIKKHSNTNRRKSMTTNDHRGTSGRSTPRKTTIVLTTPEPLEAGAEALEEVIANWAAKIGATIYRIRMSGHYYQHELWKILEAVKPKKLIPIHTKAPQAMLSIFNKYRG